MKRLIFLLLLALPLCAQQQSLGLPSSIPVHCGTVSSCTYPLVYPSTTGIVVMTQTGTATLADNYGDTWTKDFCTNYDNGNCIFSTHFNVPYPTSLTVTFPSGPSYHIYMLTYSGTWNFVLGQQGTYNNQNAPFPDCTNGGNCPYNWTLPINADAGDMLIGWSNSNSSGAGLAMPGFGFNIEASDGYLAVEDMIAPIEGAYAGSLTWRNADGSSGGGSHWVMGLAQYRRVL